jgi:hypothetical protein
MGDMGDAAMRRRGDLSADFYRAFSAVPFSAPIPRPRRLSLG